MTLGQTLVRLRKEKGLSQEQLAEQLHLTRQTISKWELDQSVPDVSNLIALSDFFDVPIDHLVRGCEDYPHAENIPVSPGTGYKWGILAGCIIAGISFMGIVAFFICSALHPWKAMVNGWRFQGLPAFLIGTNSVGGFITLCAALMIGCVLAGWSIVRKNKMS